MTFAVHHRGAAAGRYTHYPLPDPLARLTADQHPIYHLPRYHHGAAISIPPPRWITLGRGESQGGFGNKANCLDRLLADPTLGPYVPPALAIRTHGKVDEKTLAQVIGTLEVATGGKFGQARRGHPLLLAVRSSPLRSAPGVGPTICNVGRAADPRQELARAIEAVAAQMEIHGLTGGVVVQAMVFGNHDRDSGSGVAFTHDPMTGQARLNGRFARQKQGAFVVGGGIGTDLKDEGTVVAALQPLVDPLLRLFGEPQDFEFVIERGRPFIVQSRAIVFPREDHLIKALFEMRREGLAGPEVLYRRLGLLASENRARTFRVADPRSLPTKGEWIGGGEGASGELAYQGIFVSLAKACAVDPLRWRALNVDKIAVFTTDETDLAIHTMMRGEISGLVMIGGHPYAHAVILARALQLPMLYNFRPEAGFPLPYGEKVLLDEKTGLWKGKAACDHSLLEVRPFLNANPRAAIEVDAPRGSPPLHLQGLSLEEVARIHRGLTEHLRRLVENPHSFDDPSSVISFNFAVHDTHTYLKRMEAGEVETVLYSEDLYLDDRHYREMGIARGQATGSGFDRSPGETSRRRRLVETRLPQWALENIAACKALRERYGEALRVDAVFHMPHIYERFRVRALLAATQRPFFSRRIEIGSGGTYNLTYILKTKDSFPSVHQAMDEAQAVQQAHRGSTLHVYKTIDGAHDRGILASAVVVIVTPPPA